MPAPHEPSRSSATAFTVLNELAAAAASTERLGDFLRLACTEVAAALDAGCVAFFTIEGEPAEAKLAGLAEPVRVDRARLERVDPATLLPDAEERERLLLSDAWTGPLAELLSGSPLSTAVTVALRFRGAPAGVLLVGWNEPLSRPEVPRDLVRAIAVHFAAALEKDRLLEDLRGRVEELSLLNEIGRGVASSLDLERTLDQAVWALNQLVTTSTCYVLLLEGDELRFVASTPSTRYLLGTKVPVAGTSVVATAVRERRAVAVEDARNSPIVDQKLAATYQARSILAAPMLVRDQPVGAVVVAQRWAIRRFRPAEVERMMAVANHLAVAIDNARLYEDLRASYAELARAQDQLVHRERLAALGELSAVIAHEVRNPLGVMFNSLGALRRMVQPTNDARMLLDAMGEEADRLNRMVSELLEFAKPSAPDFQPVALDRLIDEAIATAVGTARTQIDVRQEIAPDTPLVPVDAQLLRRALLNLTLNAVQAMPEGGSLVASLQATDGAAVIEVRDTGPGLSDAARGRLFEPFFTTKATGTGLGLAQVKRIVDDHGGSIEVRDAVPHGTVFAIRLPLTRGPAGGRATMRGRMGGGAA